MSEDIKNPFLFCANLFNAKPSHYSLVNIIKIASLYIDENKQNQFDINARVPAREELHNIAHRLYYDSETKYQHKTILMAFLANVKTFREAEFPFIKSLIKAGADLSLDEAIDENNIDKTTHTWASVFQSNHALDEYLARIYHQEFGAYAFSDFIAKHNMLHQAVESHDLPFVKICVEELGVDINLKNSAGETPAMHIKGGNTCDFMMQYGVDWKAKDNHNLTVLAHFGTIDGDEGQKLYKRLYTSLSTGKTQPLELRESIGGSIVEAIRCGQNADRLKQMLKKYDGKPEDIKDGEENNLLQVALKHGRWAFYNYLKDSFSFEKRHKNLFGQNTLHIFLRYGLFKNEGDPQGNRRISIFEDIISRNPIFEQGDYTVRDCIMEAVHANSFLINNCVLSSISGNKTDFPQWVKSAAQHLKKSEQTEFFNIAMQYGFGNKNAKIQPLENLLDIREDKKHLILGITRLLAWKNDSPSEKTFDMISSNLFKARVEDNEIVAVNEDSADALALCILSFPQKKPDWWTNEKKHQLIDTIIDGIQKYSEKEDEDNFPMLPGDNKILALVASLVVDNTVIPEEKIDYLNNWGQFIIRQQIANSYNPDICEKWKNNMKHWKSGVFEPRLRKIMGTELEHKVRAKI